jgi:YidC/Oxa1 family membrane protein insertase
MDKRSLTAIILCFLIFIGWQKFVIEPQIKKHPAAQVTTTAQTTTPEQSAPQTGPPAAPAVPKQVIKPVETEPLQTGTGVAQVSNGSTFFAGWHLQNYKLNPGSKVVDDLHQIVGEPGDVGFAVDSPEYAYLSSVQGKLTKTAQGYLWTYEDSNVKLTREITADPNQNFADVRVNAEFKKTPPHYAFISVTESAPEKDEESRDRGLVYWTDKSIEKALLSKKTELKQVRTPVKWIGAQSRYFLLALVNQGPDAQGLLQPIGEHHARMSFVYPISGKTFSVPLRAFFGPKELKTLRSVEKTLDHTVDFGMFTFIAYPLLRLMKWIYTLVHNWGVAIIIMTFLMRLAVLPLVWKSQKSMKQMAKIQPQLQRIKEKYKDDKEALNREMLSLMKNHGYNPAAGCVPMLVQMPVFFALYEMLYSAIELYQAPFCFWIQDLSVKDPLYITPVLMTALMYFQTKLTPQAAAADPTQQKMMQWMPVIFGAFMISLPSGLTLYMLVSTAFGIIQQLILNKKMNVGNAPVVAARA